MLKSILRLIRLAHRWKEAPRPKAHFPCPIKAPGKNEVHVTILSIFHSYNIIYCIQVKFEQHFQHIMLIVDKMTTLKLSYNRQV